MTEATLSSRDVKLGLATAVIGCRVRCFHSLSSTMDTARRMAEGGAPEGVVVFAERQTQGRGRFDRPWVSPPSQNLTFSIILRPPLDRMRTLNMAASVALVEAIHATTGLTATVKWPNDIRVDGKKVAGLLIEARASFDGVESGAGHAILGVGLNVNHDPTPTLTPPAEATSLAVALGRPVDRLRVLKAFLRSLDALYAWEAGEEELFQRWRGLLDTLGQRVRVAWAGAQEAPSTAWPVEEGVAIDVHRGGDLVLRRDDGSTVTLNAGEVTVVGNVGIR